MSEKNNDMRSDYARFVTITTRWMDNDMYSHVNNVVYYSWFDTAVNEYLIREGALDLDNGPVVNFVVENQCRFFSPIRFPDTVHCGLRVTHIGRSSARFEIGVFRNDEQQAAAQGHFVHVCCDRATQRPVPMPRAMRTALERIAVRAADDQP
jgi:acyl-CoA thioester hydrolase